MLADERLDGVRWRRGGGCDRTRRTSGAQGGRGGAGTDAAGVSRSGKPRRSGGAAGVALERSRPVRALVGSSEEMGHAFQGP